MDSERKDHPVHENHGGHVCHKCGWTFPKPHPSAKHRRAHKKVCGKLEGFKLAKADDRHQSDSDLSDDDHKPAPSTLAQPLSESSSKGSEESDSVRVQGEGAGVRSEEEVFSDAVAEFGHADLRRTAQKVVDLDAHVVDMRAEQSKDLSQTSEKVVDLDACGVAMTTEESKDLAPTAGEVAGLDAHQLAVNLEETQQSSQAAEKVVGLDTHEIEMNAEEIQDSSKIAEIVDLGVRGGVDSNVKEIKDSSHGLVAGLEINVEEIKESSREAAVLALGTHRVDVNAEETKVNDGENQMLEKGPSVDNGAYDKNMTIPDQFRDLDGLQTKQDKVLQTSHSSSQESILDDRTPLALEQAQDAHLSSFSFPRSSLMDNIADDTIEGRDNSAARKMDYSTSVGPDKGAKHGEECNLSDKDAEEQQEIDEGDEVPVMQTLHNDVASNSPEGGVQSDLKNSVKAATINVSSKNLIADSRESDPKICQVHDEPNGAPGLKPLEESHPRIQSGPMELDADSGDSVGVSKATISSLPIAGVVLSNMQLKEDILLMDGLGSGNVHEEPIIDQSGLREECTMEKHQNIELASTECAAREAGPHELTFHEDSLDAESAVVNTISSKNLFGVSNEIEVTNVSLAKSEQCCFLRKDEIEATNLSLVEDERQDLGKDQTGAMSVAENEQHFSLGKDDSSHQLSHEVSPESSAVPMTGDDVSDSLEGAKVHGATETPHGILSVEKNSGCDLPYELISETPRSSIACCSEEAQVLVNNSSGWPSGNGDSVNVSHEIITENYAVPVSGNNVAESVEGAEVQKKAVTSSGFDLDRNFGHDSSHKIIPESSIQPTDGSENAYSVDEPEVHETSMIVADGPDIAGEETKANHTNVRGKCTQDGASDEASPSVLATIHESVTDDSKISSLHDEDVETDKLEKKNDFVVGSKGMAVDGGSAPFTETAEWGHAEHDDREPKMDWSIETTEKNQLDVQSCAPEAIVPLSTGTGSSIQGSSVLENCVKEDFAARDVSDNHTYSVPGEGGDVVHKGNMNASILPTDASVSSISQDDSLEGHWGSISDIPTPKEASEPCLKKGSSSGGIHADNSDVFEPPSFMTLVEPNKGDKRQATSEIQSAQKPGSLSSQPGWFPSLTHVVNESQGRKKNEEIIAKVVNWSPGKPHTPLRSLLVEANIESKHKPSQKTQDRASPAPREEHALEEKGALVKTGDSEDQKETTAKGDIEKEWSSPARLPVMKRERRKVRGWVPFVCCSSIN